MLKAIAAAQISELVAGLPDGFWTPSSVSGAIDSPVVSGSDWPLHDCFEAPPIVVLDEATAHLDSESEVAVQRALDTAMEGRPAL